MKLGTEVGLGFRPGHIVLHEDPAPPPQRDATPNFRPMSVVAKRLDKSRCHLFGTEVDLGPGHIVLDGDPASSCSPKKGTAPSLRPMSIVARAGWIKMLLGTEVGLGPGHIVLDGGPSSP